MKLKAIFKKSLSVLMAVAIAVPLTSGITFGNLNLGLSTVAAADASVYENCTEGLEYEIKDGYAYITGYHGTETNVVVGSSESLSQGAHSVWSPKIEGYNVRGINNNAFTDNPTIKTFTCYISEGYIGNEAFKNCDNLEEAYIHVSYSNIGESAFEDCDSLTSVNLYAYNSVVKKRAFFNNYNLQYLAIGSAYTTLEEMAFANCINLQTPYLVETNCLKIGDMAFANCYSIEYIAAHVSSIGDYAFSGCSSLKEVKLTSPTTGNVSSYIIRSLGFGAFANCSIEYAYLPEYLSTIPNNAFLNNFEIKFQVKENSTTKKSLDKLDAVYFSDDERMNCTEGSGTTADPYMITNYYQLQGIGRNSDTLTKSYKLANDICVPFSWNIIGEELNPFKGTFDGDFHKIYNIGKCLDGENFGGIFGYVDDASISNLIIETASKQSFVYPKMYISGNGVGRYGAIVGKGIDNNYISNCAVFGDLEFHCSHYAEGITYGGGIAGDYSGIIEECCFEGTLRSTADGDAYNGAFVSRGNCKINNCYADIIYTTVHGFTINSFTNIFSGNPLEGTVENSYVRINETTAAYQHIAAGSMHVKIKIPDENKFTNSYWTSDDDIYLNAKDNPKTSRSCSELKQQSTFENWDFDSIWSIEDGASMPKLQWIDDIGKQQNVKLNLQTFVTVDDYIFPTVEFYVDNTRVEEFDVEWSVSDDSIVSLTNIDEYFQIPVINKLFKSKKAIVLKGLKAGTAILSATINGTYTASKKISVKDAVSSFVEPQYITITKNYRSVGIPDISDDNAYAKELIKWINDYGLSSMYPEYSSIDDPDCITKVKDELLCQSVCYPTMTNDNNTLLLTNEKVTIKEMMVYIIFANETRKMIYEMENELYSSAGKYYDGGKLSLNYGLVTEYFNNFYNEYLKLEEKLNNPMQMDTNLLNLVACKGLIDELPNVVGSGTKLSWITSFAKVSLSALESDVPFEKQKENIAFLRYAFLGDTSEFSEEQQAELKTYEGYQNAIKRLTDTGVRWYRNGSDDAVKYIARSSVLDFLKYSENPSIKKINNIYSSGKEFKNTVDSITALYNGEMPGYVWALTEVWDTAWDINNSGKRLFENAQKADLGWYLLAIYAFQDSDDLNAFLDVNSAELSIRTLSGDPDSFQMPAETKLQSYVEKDYYKKFYFGENGFATFPDNSDEKQISRSPFAMVNDVIVDILFDTDCIMQRQAAIFTAKTLQHHREIDPQIYQEALLAQTLANVTQAETDSEPQIDASVISNIKYSENKTLANYQLPMGWEWDDSSIVPTVTSSFYCAKYTVNGYNVKKMVHIEVEPATPQLSPLVLQSNIGQNLYDIELPDGYTWTSENALLDSYGCTKHLAKYTPSDTDNYVTVENIEVSVITKSAGSDVPTLVGSYMVSTTDNTKYVYTITPIEGAEYSIDGTTWQTSNIFDNILPETTKTFYARIAETSDYTAGIISSVQVTFDKLNNSEIPELNVVISGENGNRTVTITPVMGAEYSFDGGITYGVNNVKTGCSGKISVAIRYAENATHSASAINSKEIDTDKSEQVALVITDVGTKTYGDDTFTLTTTGGSGIGTVSFASSDTNVIAVNGTTATIIGAGTTTITAKKTSDNDYNEATAVLNVTVAKKALDVEAGTYKLTATYGGAATPSGDLIVNTLVGKDESPIYVTPADLATKNVGMGTITVTLTVTSDSNYTLNNGTVTVPYEITAKTIIPTAEVVGEYTYDGTVKTPTVVVKGGETTLILNKDYTVSCNSINAGENAGAAIIKAVSGGNYTFTDKTVKFNIAKADAPTITDTTVSYGYGTKGEKTVEIALPAVGTATANNVTVTDDTNDIIGEIATYGTNGVTFTLNENPEDKIGKIATITITFSTQNYKDFDAKVVITLTSKQDQDAPACELTFAPNGNMFTATIAEVDGAEYSFDGTNWSTVENTKSVDPNTVVKAFIKLAETETHNASPIASAEKTSPKLTVKTPTISPNGGTFSTSTTVSLVCDTKGATIYYTTDGTTPTIASTKYENPFIVSPDTTVKAIAVKDGFENSTVATATFTKKSSGGGGGGTYRPIYPTDPDYPIVNGKEKTWTEISSDIKELPMGGKLTIDLNGNTTVPTEVIADIANKKAVISLEVDDNTSFVIDGSKIDGKVSAIDLALGTSKTILSQTNFNVIGGTAVKQFALGNIGIHAKIDVALDKKHTNKLASLMKLDPKMGKYEFVSVAKIEVDETVLLDINGKGDYLLVVDVETKKPGDLNNDMIINALDASIILKSIVYELSVNGFKSDYNGDGKTNAMDASEILKVIVGLLPDKYDLFA